MVNAPDASSLSASNHGGYYGGSLRLVVPSLWGRQTSEAATEAEYHGDEARTAVEDVGIVAGGTSSSSGNSQVPSHGPQHHFGQRDAQPSVRPLHPHHHHHHPYVSPQAGATPHPEPHPARGVRAVFDGLMSPFLSCVQPPLAACVTSAGGTWDYSSRNSSYGVRNCEEDDDCCSSVVSPVPSTPPPRPKPAAPAFVAPGYHDVVCGRGGGNARHPGNQNFRDLVAANKRIYATLTKKQKMTMARQIVDAVHSTRPPGRFLARDPRTGLWEDIGLPRSLEKASQAFRDAANEAPESSELPIDPPDVITPTSLSPATVHTPKSNRTSPPPPPILIPTHLQSVFRQPPAPVQADLPPSPSPYLQTPMLVETPSSSASSVQSDHHHYLTSTVRFPPFRSSSAPVDATLPITPRSSTSRPPAMMMTPASTPGQRRGPRRRRCLPPAADAATPPSFEGHSAAAIPMFTDEPEAPIELAYSYSHGQSCDPRQDGAWEASSGRPTSTPTPRWPESAYDDGMSSSSSAVASSSSFTGAWLPPPGGGGLCAGGRPLFSPSGLLQSRHDRPRHRYSSAASATSSQSSVQHPHSHQPHQQPQLHSVPFSSQQQQMLPQPWDDPDGMDGLVALSTAAFLRLDETD